MDGLEWKSLLKWMIWRYHYFWKHLTSGKETPHFSKTIKNFACNLCWEWESCSSTGSFVVRLSDFQQGDSCSHIEK